MSRLGWLLFTGSAVLKQASPWLEWYYGDLLPGVHVAPFWSNATDDLLDVVRRLRADDEHARALGARGLAFARANLSRASRCAHWGRVLSEYAALFEPGERKGLAPWDTELGR